MARRLPPRPELSALAKCAVLGLALSLGAWFPLAGDDAPPNFDAPKADASLDVAKVNHALGVDLFKEAALWNEDDIFVDKRLGWPNESRTYTQASYRVYPDDRNPVNVLGARAYSCVLYSERGHPTEISIVFANVGDFPWTQRKLGMGLDLKHRDQPDAVPPPALTTKEAMAALEALHLSEGDDERIERQVQEDFAKALKQDAQTINDALTGLFGQPNFEGFGGGVETREQVKRWDWQGHAFLLATPKDQYVSLRIVPTAVADNAGVAAAMDRDELKARLLARVKRTDGGDVVVTEIPMVDQGPKGYCVPATWERYLRYLGIPADMYVLAQAANTTPDGSPDLTSMVDNVDSLVSLYHRRISNLPGEINLRMLSRNIDAGLPIMWTCFIHLDFERVITKRKSARAEVTDWAAWSAGLQAGDQTEIPDLILNAKPDGANQRMIIGYNEKTNEIAISDSWSQAYAIRWMTLQEANAINGGLCYVIEP